MYPNESLDIHCPATRWGTSHAAVLLGELSFQQFNGDESTTVLHDWAGLIPSQSQWEELKAEVDRFYKTVSPEFIEAQNSVNCLLCRTDKKTKEARLQKSAKKPKQGYVYLAEDQRNQYVKIGFSTKPSHREKTLQAEQPAVDFIAVFPGTTQDERDLHVEFEQYRIRGEWFALPASTIETLKERFADRNNSQESQ